MKLKNIFPGEWESIYIGEGIEFTDVKPFEHGDDLRDLDLLTFVKTGEEEIIRRSVGRQMKIFIWADLSGSMCRSENMFFSSKPDIRDIAIGILIFSACNNYCPTGLCIFNNIIDSFLPAKYGMAYCDRIIELVKSKDNNRHFITTDISNAIPFLIKKIPKQSLLFFVSDFQDKLFEGDFSQLLRPITKKFDFIPVVIRDPLEKDFSLKKAINIAVKDNEGDGRAEIYLTPQKLKEIQEFSNRLLVNLEENFHKLGVDYIVLDSPTIEGCYQVIAGFFDNRKRTRL